jgi:hypothetical protein
MIQFTIAKSQENKALSANIGFYCVEETLCKVGGQSFEVFRSIRSVIFLLGVVECEAEGPGSGISFSS